MLTLETLLVFVHVFANLVWIGSIAATALILGSSVADAAARAGLALSVYRRLAVPAFATSFAAGVLRLALDTQLYFVATKFMHAKLLFALGAIAVHHVIGARAKRTGRELPKQSANMAVWLAALLVCAGAATFFASLKPF